MSVDVDVFSCCSSPARHSAACRTRSMRPRTRSYRCCNVDLNLSSRTVFGCACAESPIRTRRCMMNTQFQQPLQTFINKMSRGWMRGESRPGFLFITTSRSIVVLLSFSSSLLSLPTSSNVPVDKAHQSTLKAHLAGSSPSS